MSTSVLYAGNDTPQVTVAAGSIVSFPSIVRKYGKNIGISGGNVIASGMGYYRGIVNITYIGSAAGTLDVEVFKNGVAIPFANVSATTAENVINSIAIPFRIRNKCCSEDVITVVASGAVVTITNAAISVEKD